MNHIAGFWKLRFHVSFYFLMSSTKKEYLQHYFIIHFLNDKASQSNVQCCDKSWKNLSLEFHIFDGMIPKSHHRIKMFECLILSSKKKNNNNETNHLFLEVMHVSDKNFNALSKHVGFKKLECVKSFLQMCCNFPYWMSNLMLSLM